MSRYIEAMLVINEVSLEQFTWGRSDCLAFTARVVRACTSVNFRELFDYTSKEEADRILSEYGDVGALMADVLRDYECVRGAETDNGDPLLLDLPVTLLTSGVRLGDKAVFKTERGVSHIPITSPRVLRGWRVR